MDKIIEHILEPFMFMEEMDYPDEHGQMKALQQCKENLRQLFGHDGEELNALREWSSNVPAITDPIKGPGFDEALAESEIRVAKLRYMETLFYMKHDILPNPLAYVGENSLLKKLDQRLEKCHACPQSLAALRTIIDRRHGCTCFVEKDGLRSGAKCDYCKLMADNAKPDKDIIWQCCGTTDVIITEYPSYKEYQVACVKCRKASGVHRSRDEAVTAWSKMMQGEVADGNS